MLTELLLKMIKNPALGSLPKLYHYIISSYAAAGYIGYIADFWHPVWESNTLLVVKYFAYYHLCSTQDQRTFTHSIQKETTAAQSAEKSLVQNIPNGGTFVIHPGNKRQFQIPTEREVPWLSEDSSTCPTTFTIPQSHWSLRKKTKKPLYKILEDETFTAYYMPNKCSTSGQHSTRCNFDPNWFCSFQRRARYWAYAKVMRVNDRRNYQ